MAKKYKALFKNIGIQLKTNILSAILAYLLLIIAYPLLIEDKSKEVTLKRAAIFGALSYGIYGFTVATILPKYNIGFAITETLWGATLYFLATKLLLKIY